MQLNDLCQLSLYGCENIKRSARRQRSPDSPQHLLAMDTRSVTIVCLVTTLFLRLSHGQPSLVDWCSVEDRLCYGQPHIGCDRTKFAFGGCEKVNVINFDDDLKVVITERHNEYRSKLALGEVPEYPKASKMQEMIWDNNLSYLALKHAKHCKFKHDYCRATEDFPYSGQNIALRSTMTANTSYPGVIEAMIDRWFRESRNSDPRVVEEFTENDLHIAGHFSLISRESNTHVGCGYITFETDDEDGHWYSHMLTCNYADNNVLGTSAYVQGEHCAQCKDYGKHCSKIYRGLCAKHHVVRT